MPYRIDVSDTPPDAFDRLVALGALDVDALPGSLAAVMPDNVSAEAVAVALGVDHVRVSPAIGRDDGSVWILAPRPVRAGGVLLLPAGMPAQPRSVRLVDSGVFGTGLHPTTALCLELIDQMLVAELPDSLLDVGTGSGVLALAALVREVPRAVGLDIDTAALQVAAENARINDCAVRLELVQGGPDAVGGTWPLVLANVLAAPLIEMAPALVKRVGHHGRLVLSGIHESTAEDVARIYRRFGMRQLQVDTKAGWCALVFQAPW